MISSGCELDLLVVSDGWLNRLMEQNKLALHQMTTVYQIPPQDYVEKMIHFTLQVQFKLSSQQTKRVETAIWLDALTHSTIEERGGI